MNKDSKFFLIGFLSVFSASFFLNIFQSNIEDLFLAREIAENPPTFFLANISQNYLKPASSQDCFVLAESALSVEINREGRERVLFEKNASQKMPIASLTKLMTAIIADEFYRPDYKIKISQKAVAQEELTGNLKPGEQLSVQDLLYIMLLESSNDAAFAIAEPMSVYGFVDLMNLKAKRLGLKDFQFVNPTGLDPEGADDVFNYASAQDLVALGKYLLKKPEILEIISKKEYNLYLADGTFHHTLQSTNQLLGELPEIIGGKTGWTETAGGCLFVLAKGKQAQTYRINVVLNSPDRFADIRNLLNCLNKN